MNGIASRSSTDTGQGVDEFEGALRKALEETGTTELACILITHRHAGAFKVPARHAAIYALV